MKYYIKIENNNNLQYYFISSNIINSIENIFLKYSIKDSYNAVLSIGNLFNMSELEYHTVDTNCEYNRIANLQDQINCKSIAEIYALKKEINKIKNVIKAKKQINRDKIQELIDIIDICDCLKNYVAGYIMSTSNYNMVILNNIRELNTYIEVIREETSKSDADFSSILRVLETTIGLDTGIKIKKYELNEDVSAIAQKIVQEIFIKIFMLCPELFSSLGVVTNKVK